MSTSRILPIVNLVGCVLITGIIVAQWLKERGLGGRIDALNQQLVTARDQYAAEKTRAATLESDVAQLKESVEATVRSRKEAEDALAKLIAGRETEAASAAQAARVQVENWEKAIAERDAKIRELNENLAAARQRLDEAIAKLKAAAR